MPSGIGLAQIMMQCGMFVPAKAFTANVCERTLTHLKREEDTAMESGKFDGNSRWSMPISDHLMPNAMVLLIKTPSPPRTNVKAPRSRDRSSVR